LSSSADCPEPTASPTDDGASPAPGEDDLTLSFSESPSPLQPGASVRWSFAVRNSGDESVTLTFPTGQNGDVVLTGDGAEAYRWSSCCVFTQAIREVQLAAGETWTFSLSDTLDVEPGTYELEASVVSDPAPAPVRRQVQVGDAASASPTSGASPTPDGEPTSEPTTTATTEPTDAASSTSTPEPTPEGTP
jgi:hypothetical protein